MKFTTLTILSVQFKSVKYIHTVVQPIFRTLFILQNWNYLLNNNSPLPPPS